MGFGERLKAMRKQRKMTMQELADKVGVAKSTYAGYEANYRQPPLESVVIMAKQLQTSADYLLGLTENPSPKDSLQNIKDLLANDLHWDGVRLSGEDLQPIRAMIELVAVERRKRKWLEQKAKTESE